MNRRVVDFTIQLASTPNLAELSDMRGIDVLDRVAKVIEAARMAGVSTGNVMILDTGILRRDGTALIQAIRSAGFAASVMIDPREKDSLDLLNHAFSAGAQGLKFHPYFLELTDEGFDQAVALALHAQERDMWIAVCCSYGTVRVFDVSGPRLLAALVRGGITAPLVALHAGGAAVLDVMSVALDAPNVLIETSFSLRFWQDSSVEQDLAFAIRKVGVDRCLHGSDHPFVPFDEAVEVLTSFLERHSFSNSDAAQILSGTARTRLGL